MSEEDRTANLAQNRVNEAKERERRLKELSKKRAKARQVTAKKEQKKEEEEERMKSNLSKETATKESTNNAKRIFKVGKRGAAAAGLYLGAKNAPVMKLKLKDKEGGQKTLEIKALTGDDTLDGDGLARVNYHLKRAGKRYFFIILFYIVYL